MEQLGGERKPSIGRAVLIGGIVGGVLGVVPVLYIGNCCCCLWFALGGVIATLIYRGMLPYSLTSGIGATLGFVSGIVSGLVTSIVWFLILNSFLKNPALYDPESELRRTFEENMRSGYSSMNVPTSQVDQIVGQFNQVMSTINPQMAIMYLLIGLILLTVIGAVASMIAGIITVAVAGKKQAPIEEPPPYKPL